MFFKKQSGLSIVELLIGIGILSIIGTLAMKGLNFSLKSSQRITNNADMQAIKHMMLGRIDCIETMKKANCSGSKKIVKLYEKLTNNSTRVLADNNVSKPTKFGDWSIRAQCDDFSGVSGISLRIARLKKNGTLTSKNEKFFKKDPLTNKVITWNNDKSLLFPKGVPLCTSSNNKLKQELREIFKSVIIVKHARRDIRSTRYHTAKCPPDHFLLNCDFTAGKQAAFPENFEVDYANDKCHLKATTSIVGLESRVRAFCIPMKN